MTIVYADNNATTKVAPEVVAEMTTFLTEKWGNPSSMHQLGGDVEKAIESAREKVAACLGAAQPTEIIFTSGGTESDNTAIRSALASRKGRRKIITSRVEHPAVLNLCKNLEREGYQVRYLPVDNHGLLSLDDLREAMDEDVALVTLMAANNETGVLFPVEQAGEIAHEYGALFHTDAVQAMGKVPVDLSFGHVDLLSVSGHKIHGPKGIGALYVRRGCRFRPFIVGGHQERGRRGGTENVPGIAAMGRAAELALAHMADEQIRVKKLRDTLEEGLLKIPLSRVNGKTEKRLPGTSNISFKNVEGEALLLMLDQKGICASSGSACTSGTLEPSHVLRAMGVPFTYAHGSLRFSLGRYNTEDDVTKILKELPPIVTRLRELSPFSG
ncbi:MAG: cysteine desulfurase NifS [Deltaproteobacteria bacterium]|nr:cysteine desulfurase NifS [Deltaproteobacteria bacterium]MBN2672697.1 cysteine desulfurase NifS [Deltaproteobacteria bacterium]